MRLPTLPLADTSPGSHKGQGTGSRARGFRGVERKERGARQVGDNSEKGMATGRNRGNRRSEGWERTTASLCDPCLHFPFLLPRPALGPVPLQHHWMGDRARIETVRVRTVGATRAPDSPWEGARFPTGGSLGSQPAGSPWAQLTPEFPALFSPSIHLLCPSQPVCITTSTSSGRKPRTRVGDSKDYSIPLSSEAQILPLSQVPSAPESFTVGHSRGLTE